MRDLLPDLHAALMQADSATQVLEHFLGAPLVAVRVACEPVEPTPEQRARLGLDLGLGAQERWVHRRVVLAARGMPVSQADLWYVPHRLDPAMVDALERSDRPFGHVVSTLRPRRTTLFSRLSAAGETPSLEHRALLTIAGTTGPLPIAEVHERYVVGGAPAA